MAVAGWVAQGKEVGSAAMDWAVLGRADPDWEESGWEEGWEARDWAARAMGEDSAAPG